MTTSNQLSRSILYQLQPNQDANPATNKDDPPPLIRLQLSNAEKQKLLSPLSEGGIGVSIQLAGPNSAIHLGSDSISSISLQLSDRDPSSLLHRLDSDSNSLHSIGPISKQLSSISSASSTESQVITASNHQELASKLRKRREEDEAKKRDKAVVLLDPEEQRRLQSKSSGRKSSSSNIKNQSGLKSRGSSSGGLGTEASSSSSKNASPHPATSNVSSTPTKSSSSSSSNLPVINQSLRRLLIQTLASSPLKRKYLASHLETSETQLLALLDLVATPVQSQEVASGSSKAGKESTAGPESDSNPPGPDTLYALKDELFTQVHFSKGSWKDYSSAQRKNASFNAEKAFERLGLLQDDAEVGSKIWARLWPEGGRAEWLESNLQKDSLEKSVKGKEKQIKTGPDESLEEGEERESEVDLKNRLGLEITETRTSLSPAKRSNVDVRQEETDGETSTTKLNKVKSSGSTQDRLRRATKNRKSGASTSASTSSQRSTIPTISSTKTGDVERKEPTELSIPSNKKIRKQSRSVSPPAWSAAARSKKAGAPTNVSTTKDPSNAASKKNSAEIAKARASDSSPSNSKRKAQDKVLEREAPSSSTRGKDKARKSMDVKKGKKVNPRDVDYTDSEEDEKGGDGTGGKSSSDCKRKSIKDEPVRPVKSNSRLDALNRGDVSISQSVKSSTASTQKRDSSSNDAPRGRPRERPQQTLEHNGSLDQLRSVNIKLEDSKSSNASRDGSRIIERYLDRESTNSYSRSISFDSRSGSYSSLDDEQSFVSRSAAGNRNEMRIKRSDSQSLSFRSGTPEPGSHFPRSPSVSDLNANVSLSFKKKIQSVPLRPPGPGVAIQTSEPWLSLKSSSDYVRLAERFLKTFQEYRELRVRCEKEKEMLLMEEGILEGEMERENRESSMRERDGRDVEFREEERGGGEGEFERIGNPSREGNDNSDGMQVEMEIDSKSPDQDEEDKFKPEPSLPDISISHSIPKGKQSQNPPSSPEEGEMTPQVEQFPTFPTSTSNSTITAIEQERRTSDQSILRQASEPQSRSQSPPSVWRSIPPLIATESSSSHHLGHHQFSQRHNRQALISRPMSFRELEELVTRTKELFGQLKRMRETLLEHKEKMTRVE